MTLIDPAPPAILGRTGELDRLGALFASARNGVGGGLAVVGEPGIGKTALLDAAVDRARGIRVLRSDGYEAESAIPYAAVQRLGAPLAEHLGGVPPRQAAALRIAAGIDEGLPPDRFLVGLGLLSLLAAAGEVEPIAWVVDDAHLIDPESLDVLAFVARRLAAERVALLLSSRPDPRVHLVAAGVPALELGGLEPADAVRLLNGSMRGVVDPLLATRIAEETGGNPLALIDLGREFTAEELTESSVARTPVPLGERLEAHYLRQVDAIPPESRRWLLVAAAESTGDGELVRAASERLGVPADAAGPAEYARLVSVRRTIEFRHPLVRSAVYNGVPADDRRRAHEALAAIADERGRAELAVWHSAAAAVGPDDGLAARMEEVADAAGVRGGSLSRARLLTRAADLTTDGPERDLRIIAAAEAAASAGAVSLALEMVARLDDDRLDPVGLGRVLTLRAMLALFVADHDGVVGGSAMMLRAATLFHGRSPELEQRALLRAFDYVLMAEWAAEGVSLPELGRRLADGATVADGPMSVQLRALAAHVLQPYGEAVPLMREAVATIRGFDDAQLLDLGSVGVALTMALWEEQVCVELLERMLSGARDGGVLRVVDSALWLLGLIELVRGDPASSGRYIEQVRELRRAMGYDAEQVVNASHLAWSGAPTEVVAQIADAVLPTGFAGAWTIAMTGLGIRQIADGHYRDAFERFAPLVARNFLQVTYQQLPDFVEAGVRSGHADVVRPSAERLAGFAAESGTPWVRGVAARSHALLADDADAEPRYLEAIGHLKHATAPGDLGRAHLVYGEWLRRMKRRREAREELKTALAIFTRVGAPAFAARARRELEATGEHVPHHLPGDDGAETLTPQEATIARMAAEGQTNAEIGATLFISANTVDYHLRKVFRKLGVTSRKQLAERLGDR
ncbi:LuxR C-terminal-related transcriptional regulator [Agromyces indicus]|uniref:LuxR C-terminal-related transcriptional regulator n=1 Tax=Agromyces indicus TaxID=758919 RepID=A0ABU1FJ06_9MICO|nr:LuxR C-terminal-related transcriptional regulator [Agromyces indicus]MDR5691376.1 LuxR C-terminal-related transcriptional regulator [Agromyces indicus]